MASPPPPPGLAALLLLAGIAFFCSPSQADDYPPIVSGLSFSFYKSKCPHVEHIVRNYLQQEFKSNIGLAAGLLRIHFHDCFVQGCDASVQLDGSASEKTAIPNLTLRPAAFKAINDLQTLITEACGQVVSCADISALAARDSVYLSGGPKYKVPLGRRDGLSPASTDVIFKFLPPPTSDVSFLISSLGLLNLDTTDLVTLSGAHTIGIAHCPSFQDRLFPTQDPTLGKCFAKGLYATCPVKDTDNTTVNDIRTPNIFDNKYYVDLLNKEGLFTSDQGLYGDARTKPIVTSFALSQSLFFHKFVYSMTKMGQLNVLTGNQGEIRRNCSAVNSGGQNDLLRSVVDGAAGKVSE